MYAGGSLASQISTHASFWHLAKSGAQPSVVCVFFVGFGPTFLLGEVVLEHWRSGVMDTPFAYLAVREFRTLLFMIIFLLKHGLWIL